MGRVAAVLVLGACAIRAAGCGADEDPVPLAEPPPASEAPSVEEATTDAWWDVDLEEPLEWGCFASGAEPPPGEQALVDGAIVGAESAPQRPASDLPDESWTGYEPGLGCTVGASAAALYVGDDLDASVLLTLAVDEPEARQAVAEAPALLGVGGEPTAERTADGGLGDERVTITRDGLVGMVWRRERFVAVVLLQHATGPGADAAAEQAARGASTVLVSAQDARITEALRTTR